ncbi:MAG: FecCD family ABC transporter permease [Dehalococcoidia bacterium]
MNRADALAASPRRRGHATLQTRAFAVRLNVRVLLLCLIAAGCLAVLATWAMSLGSFPVPFGEVVKSVVGEGAPENDFIVRTLRLPRVLCAMLVGAALAMSGAIFQGLVRNPLVSPDIIGINTGATLVAVFWIVTLRDPALLPVAAFAGATLTAALIYLLTWKGGISGNRLVLVGIGVSALLQAGTTFLMIRYPIERVSSAQLWSTGSLYGSDWQDVRVLLIGLLLLAPCAVALMWPLRVLQLGDDASRGVGLPLERTRLGLIVAGCGLSAISIAVAGPIGFVALMTPHIARMLAGPLSGSVLVFTAFVGGLVVLTSDTVGQHFLPVSMPVGVVTAAIGAPYFLFLLYRSNLRI